MAEVSTKPYLVRAIYEWCADSGYRPFIAVAVDARTQVPREFVRNGEIVLNISAEATDRLHIGNDLLEFVARFGGVARHVSIPIDNVSAIFAQETGHGMAFEVPAHARDGAQAHEVDAADEEADKGVPSGALRPATLESDGDDAADEPKGESTAPSDPDDAASGRKPAGKPAVKRRAPVKRTVSKRACKTVLRDVSARPAGPAAGPEAGPAGPDTAPIEADAGGDTGAPGKDAAGASENTGTPGDAGASVRKAAGKPTIAAVPKAAVPRTGKAPSKDASDQGTESAEHPDDDGPGPSAPKRGKPRLTRVK